MKSKSTWLKSIYFLTWGSLCLMLAGFGWAIREMVKPPENSQPPSETASLSLEPGKKLLLGLGDSLTRGVGDHSGQGYFGIIQKKWRHHFPRSQSINLSVRGQTSQHLRDQLKKAHIREFVKEADALVITIGGNDLFHGSEDLEKTDPQAILERENRFRKNLVSILSDIQRLNPVGSVYLLSLYNPFADLKGNELTSKIVADWNHTLTATAQSFPQVTVIPVYDLFLKHPETYLYSDHFHPNQQGYRQIADRLWQVMTLESPEEGKSHAEQADS